ncbi:hypothetical protein HPB52_017045 [Rhipicephalus sanguineus]|uniref:Gustatory receptor n=1 Tax=Rhipicephalus sanguineus TaxID=34632 RepID=A0A9D4T7R5_RHISA|nr:hypothetical protein HPB52_017045 [Rhipicephalus sanguineus]
MDDPQERSASVTWPRYFVLIIVDVLAAYQLVLLAIDVFLGTTIRLSFAHLQLLTGYLASALSGHIFMSSIGKLQHYRLQCHADTKTTRKGQFRMPSLSRALLVSSFVAFAILDVCAQSFKPFKQLADLACFYIAALLKLAVMLNYLRLVEDAQAVIRRLGTVTAQEVREFGAALLDVFKMVHSLEAAFSLLVLVWYAELMLAIVASVHIGLSFVEKSRSFWLHGVRLPRNLYLLSVYALLSHRLCSVHGEARKMATTLGPGLSSRTDPRRGAVCGAVKILRRCASLGEAFTLTALDSFDLDDRFYLNTLGSVIMYGVILQQLTTTAG